jgi:hypothetical protein
MDTRDSRNGAVNDDFLEVVTQAWRSTCGVHLGNGYCVILAAFYVGLFRTVLYIIYYILEARMSLFCSARIRTVL